MTRNSLSPLVVLLLVSGCGLIVDLPDAQVDDGGSVGTGGAGDGDDNGDGDGSAGEQETGGTGSVLGDGDGDEPVGGDGGKRGDGGSPMGGMSSDSGGSDSGGSDSGGSPPTGGDPSTGGTSGECEEPCDCDGDGALRDDVECGGDDCDDDDNRVFPDQTMFFSTPANEVIGFDYNCDGDIQRPPGQDQTLNCAAISLGSCSTTQGFEELPVCGGRADWGTCVSGTLKCVFSSVEDNRIMRCH